MPCLQLSHSLLRISDAMPQCLSLNLAHSVLHVEGLLRSAELKGTGNCKDHISVFWKCFNSERDVSSFPFIEELGEMFLPDKGISLVVSWILNLNYWLLGCETYPFFDDFFILEIYMVFSMFI